MERKEYLSSSLPDLSIFRSSDESFLVGSSGSFPSLYSDYGSASSYDIGHSQWGGSSASFREKFLGENSFKGYKLSGSWLSDETLYNVIRIIYPDLYSGQIVRLDVVGPSDGSLDTLRQSLSSHISSNSSVPFTSLVHINGNHWVSVLVTQESPSVYHAYYANSLEDSSQDAMIVSALTDSNVSKIEKLSVCLQEDGNSCGIYAIAHANAMVRALQADRMSDLIRDGIKLSPLIIGQLDATWSHLLDHNKSSYCTLSPEDNYINRPIELSDPLQLSRCNVDALRAAMASFTNGASSDSQYSSAGHLSLVDEFIAYMTEQSNASALLSFKEKIVPILKEKLTKEEISVQESIIYCFMQGVRLSYDILSNRPVNVWVEESLVSDLKVSYSKDSDKFIYGELVAKLDALVNRYRSKDKKGSLNVLLYSIRDATKESSMSLVDLLDLLTFLSPNAPYTDVSTLLKHSKEWSSWLPGRYMDDLLSSNQVTLDVVQRDSLIRFVSNGRWRPCMISKLVTIVKSIPDFSPVSNFIKFISDHKFATSFIESSFYADVNLDGSSCLHNCIGLLASSLVKSRINYLFPDHKDIFNNQLPSFFRYASPVDSLAPFNNLLDALNKALNSSSSDGFPVFLQSIQVDHPVNESISTCFVKCLNLLYEYKVDASTAIEAFKRIGSHIDHPSTWESHLHKLVISLAFQGIKQYTRSELIDQINALSPDFSCTSNKDGLDFLFQEVMNSYNGYASMLPDPSICKWNIDHVKTWSSRVKKASCVPDKEIIAVIFHAVYLHHGYCPRDTQLLTLLILSNPSEGLGRLAQVNTGEGKSVIIAMLSAFYALKGRQVDVITTSTELTIPEVERQFGFYAMLKVSVGENSRQDFNATQDLLKEVYKKEVVYGTPIDFQGDILRTEFSGMDTRSDRKYDTCIVDEADSMLYDERKSATRLSSPLPGMNHLSIVLSYIWYEMDRVYKETIHHDGKDYYLKNKIMADSDVSTLSDDSDPLALWDFEEIKDMSTFIKSSVTKSVQSALRDLTPEERSDLKAEKLLKKKRSELGLKCRNTERKIYEYRSKISKEYQTWWGRTCQKLGNAFNVDTDCKKYERKLSEAELALPGIKSELKRIEEAILSSPMSKNEAVLEIPLYLRSFALSQLPHWINNAILARFILEKDCDYTVENGHIVPVDYINTGVLQHNVIWSDGMHQFLQIKEGCKVTPESVCTNFITNASFFKRYGSSLFGVTGTLGNASMHNFFRTIYDVDMVVIPPYQVETLPFNKDSSYKCQELVPIIKSSESDWYQSICDSACSKVRNDRAVLMICKSIKQVSYIHKRLLKDLGKTYKDKIFTYTGTSDKVVAKDTPSTPSHTPSTSVLSSCSIARPKFTKRNIDCGEIIIATNIAGRGTDFITTSGVESAGGMHVCLSFLPSSYRVEMQNAGRTARQGRKGSVQLVLHDVGNRPISSIRSYRDQKDDLEISRSKQDVRSSFVSGQFFNSFCALESKLLRRASDTEKLREYNRILADWSVVKTSLLNTDKIKSRFDKIYAQRLQSSLKIGKDAFTEGVSKKDQESKAFRDALAGLEEDIKSDLLLERQKEELQYPDKVRESFCIGLQSHKYNSELISCFRLDKPFVSQGSNLATQYNWGEFERKGLQERWGFWYSDLDHSGKYKSSESVSDTFSAFNKEILSDGQKDKLIQNPYYYVEKGNEALDYLRNPTSSIKIYQKAIDLSESCYDQSVGLGPTYSLTARYNKARALLTIEDNKGNQRQARSELQETLRLIEEEYEPSLGTFNCFLGFLGRDNLDLVDSSDHVIHQLDILSRQASYIENAIDVIDEAIKKGWEVRLVNQSLPMVLTGLEGDHSQAIFESYCNGLTNIFVLNLYPPRSWGKIIGLALLSAAQFTAGFLLLKTGVGTVLGQKLISSSFSDLYDAIWGIKTRDIKFGSWFLNKSIYWGLSAINFRGKADKIDLLSSNPSELTQPKVEQVVTQSQGVLDKSKTNPLIDACNKLSVQDQNKKISIAQLGHIFKTTATSKIQNLAINQLAINPTLTLVRKELDKVVDRKISDRLRNNSLIQEGIAIDHENRNNRWQNVFIQSAVDLIESSCELKNAFISLSKGIAVKYIDSKLDKKASDNKSYQLTGQDYFDIVGLGKMTYDLVTILPSFLDKFESSINEYASKIKSYKSYKASNGQEANNASSSCYDTSEDDMPPSDPSAKIIHASSVPIDKAVKRTDLNLTSIQSAGTEMGRNHVAYIPSSIEFIKNSFKAYLANRLTNSIGSNLLDPIKDRLVNYTTKKIWEEDAKILHEAKQAILPVIQIDRLIKALNRKGNEGKKPVDPQNLNKQTQDFLSLFQSGAPVGIEAIGQSANIATVKFYICIDGRFHSEFGPKEALNVIHLDLVSTKDGPHWVSTKPLRTLSLDQTIGKNDCFFSSMFQGLDDATIKRLEIENTDQLRQLCVEGFLKNPKITQEMIHNRSLIQTYNPKAIHEGGCNEMMLMRHSMRRDPHDVMHRESAMQNDIEYRWLEDEKKRIEKKLAEEKSKSETEKSQIKIANYQTLLSSFAEQQDRILVHRHKIYLNQQQKINDVALRFTINSLGLVAPPLRFGTFLTGSLIGTLLDKNFYKCLKNQDFKGAFGVGRDNTPIFGSGWNAYQDFKEGDVKGGTIATFLAASEACLWIRPIGNKNLNKQGIGVKAWIKPGKLKIIAKAPSVSEKRAAEYMKNRGHKVELRDAVGTRAGGKTSDLVVDGKNYDVYTPKSGNPNRIISEAAKKNSQAEGLVIDLSNTDVRVEQLGDVLKCVRGAGATNIKDIIIISK